MTVSSEEGLWGKTYIPLKSYAFSATFPGSQQKWYSPLTLMMPCAFKLVPLRSGGSWEIWDTPKQNRQGVYVTPKPHVPIAVGNQGTVLTYCAHRSGRSNPRGTGSSPWTCRRCRCAGMSSPGHSQTRTSLGDILLAGHRQKNRQTKKYHRPYPEKLLCDSWYSWDMMPIQ